MAFDGVCTETIMQKEHYCIQCKERVRSTKKRNAAAVLTDITIKHFPVDQYPRQHTFIQTKNKKEKTVFLNAVHSKCLKVSMTPI